MGSRIAILLVGLWLTSGCAHLPVASNHARPFCYLDDTFAFANETVWNYQDGVRVTNSPPRQVKTESYTRRCFVMSRAVVQFWKFARFEPAAPPLDPQELARRVRIVAHQAPWDDCWPQTNRVVFAGYANLREMSAPEGKVLRAHLGSGWATYFHPRNYCMQFVPSKEHQARTHDMLRTTLERGQPMILWLYNFPTVDMNHCVVVYDEVAATDGRFAYAACDPNYTDRPRTLEYDPQTRAFSYSKTFYFKGGPVHARAIYLGPFH